MPNPLDIISSATEFAKDIVDRFFPKKMTEEEKSAASLEIQKLLESRETTIISANRDVMIAELAQEDSFVKRARPMITYTGLFVIVFNYVVVPFLNRILEWIAIWKDLTNHAALLALQPVELPEMFWIAWGGVVAVYSAGRTWELVKGGKARPN